MNRFLRSQRSGLVIGIGILCRISSLAEAANVAVINGNDALAGSLRQAIQDANPGDTIVFQIPKSSSVYDSATGIFTIGLTSNGLTVNKSLTIDGGGQKIVIKPAGSAHIGVFQIVGGNVTIVGITMSNGVTSGSGAGISNQGNLTVRGWTCRRIMPTVGMAAAPYGMQMALSFLWKIARSRTIKPPLVMAAPSSTRGR